MLLPLHPATEQAGKDGQRFFLTLPSVPKPAIISDGSGTSHNLSTYTVQASLPRLLAGVV